MERKKGQMKSYGESPIQQIKRRFRKNLTAMAGWYFIILSFLVAVFAYVIIPGRF